MPERDVVRLAGEHARDLGFTFFCTVYLPHADRRGARAFRFVEHVVTVGPRRELREVCDADDLFEPRERADARPNGRSGRAPDRRVDLVEDQRASRLARIGNTTTSARRTRESSPPEATRARRASRLAGIGGEEKLHSFGALWTGVLERLERDLERARPERDVGKLRENALAQRRRGRSCATCQHLRGVVERALRRLGSRAELRD